MRVILTGFGSTGDIQPVTALALELQKNNHDCTMVLAPVHKNLIESQGLKFIALGSEGIQSTTRGIIEAEMTDGIYTDSQLRSLLPISSGDQMIDDLCEHVTGADVFISGTQFPVGPIIYKRTHVPFVSVNVAHYSHKYMKHNRFTLREQQIAVIINEFLRKYGCAQVVNPLSQGGNSDQLTLYAISRLLIDPAQEENWPAAYKVTGFFFTENPGWQPDAALEAFLAAEEDPPILISFGSMVHGDPQAMSDLLIDAVTASGYRAIIQAGWSGLTNQGNPHPAIFFLNHFVPFSWLFPQVACVIHHGGAGTLAWTLKAGVPSIVIPHLWDQFALGLFVEEKQCGRKILIEDLSADYLATTIDEVVNDPRYRQSTQKVKEIIDQEHGLHQARALIEELVQA